MNFLIDQNRSPRLAELLREAGHDAVHTLDSGMARATDDELLELAAHDVGLLSRATRTLGLCLRLARSRSPSVILFRARNMPRAEVQAATIIEHVIDVTEDLQQGAILAITDDRIRVRRLPLLHEE